MSKEPFLLSPRSQAALSVLGTAVAFLFTLLLLKYHAQLILNPFPLEPREGAIPLTTHLLLKGENPFAVAHQPQHANIYGIFFNLLILPLAKFFGSGLVFHRAMNGLFLLASAGLIFTVLRQKKVPLFLNLSGVVILYASWLYYTTPTAKPDGLGILLFFGSLWIPYLRNYSRSSLVISAVLGVLAFYTKIYGVLSIPCLGLYLFLFVCRKKGLAYLVGSLALFLLSVPLVQYFYECYFNNILFLQIGFAKFADAGLYFSSLQFISLLIIHKGIFFILVLALSGDLFDYLKTKKPFGRPDLAGFTIFPLFAVIFFSFGRHSGGWVHYFFHLLTPFLVVFVLDQIKTKKFLYPLVLCALIVDMGYFSFKLLKIQEAGTINGDPAAWKKAYALVSGDKNVFASSVMTPLFMTTGQDIYDSGHSDCFIFGAFPPAILKQPPNQKILTRYETFRDEVARAIQEKKFDLIAYTDGSILVVPEDLIKEHYQLKESLPLTMSKVELTTTLFVWEPRE